jgi:hypothetical protein
MQIARRRGMKKAIVALARRDGLSSPELGPFLCSYYFRIMSNIDHVLRTELSHDWLSPPEPLASIGD